MIVDTLMGQLQGTVSPCTVASMMWVASRLAATLVVRVPQQVEHVCLLPLVCL